MKFHAIVGNPPYNDNGGLKKGGKNLYSKFIELSLSLLNDDGYLSFVTNAGILKTTTGERTELLNKILSGNLVYLNIHECKKWFPKVGGAMIFCYFIFQNNTNYQGTKCISQLHPNSQVYEDVVDLSTACWVPRIATNDVIGIINKCTNPTFNFERIDDVKNSNRVTNSMIGFKRLNHLVKPYSVMATDSINSGTFIVTESNDKNQDIEFFNSNLFSFLNVIHRYDPIAYHKTMRIFSKPIEDLNKNEIELISDILN
jgi:hypothetical protein